MITYDQKMAVLTVILILMILFVIIFDEEKHGIAPYVQTPTSIINENLKETCDHLVKDLQYSRKNLPIRCEEFYPIK